MAEIIGEALEQLELGVDLVEVLGTADLLRVLEEIFRIDENVRAHAITYGHFRPPGDDVFVLELLETLQ